MKVKADKIKDLERLGFKKGIYYYNLQVDGFGKTFLRVNMEDGVIDINSRKANGSHIMLIPNIIIKMIKEGWIEE